MILLNKAAGLYGVAVPKGTHKFKLWPENYLSYQQQIKNKYSEVDRYVNIGCFFRIIGTCTKEVIDFDCEPYVDRVAYAGEKGTNTYAALFMNYKWEKPLPVSMACGTPQESFYSLLHSVGVLWENPLGENPKDDALYLNIQANIKWTIAQSKVIDKLVIIQKVK